MYKIESGVSVPPTSGFAALAEQMQVGDSVVVETQSEASSLCAILKRRGFAAMQRRVGAAEGRSGVRVWRVS